MSYTAKELLEMKLNPEISTEELEDAIYQTPINEVVIALDAWLACLASQLPAWLGGGDSDASKKD